MRRDDAGGGSGFHDLIDSVRRSISFRPAAGLEPPAVPFGAGGGGIGLRISSCIRKSRGMGMLGLMMPDEAVGGSGEGGGGCGGGGEENPPIRWRKGELIGAGAFGQVYLGMNLDSGELLAVKQVLIGTSNATRAHIRELEEEVKLLKNLSHPYIVRYLGTVREEDTLNILLEFVPGGSIQSLLGKLGSFPEPVIKKYTKQILQGLEYLHNNAIIHRDIKGANILVDNKGCIKLADFGASKQVAKLATVTAAKTMKGTPYWMAPEVIVGSGYSFSADIWSVGCTVIEMATGKPPWSQQYQEVALLFHVGTTKSHPPIPEHLSLEGKDFLLKCLQKEPELRSTASDLVKHPFVTGEPNELQPLNRAAHKDSFNETPANDMPNGLGLNQSSNWSTMNSNKSSTIKPLWEGGSCDDDVMCEFADKDDYPAVGSSYNPMSEPFDNWESKFDMSPEQNSHQSMEFGGLAKHAESSITENDSTFPVEGSCEDDDVLTESKIKAVLEEKALDLKKLQTPLYEEFYNTVNAGSCQEADQTSKGKIPASPKLPPRGKSPPSKTRGGASPTCDNLNNASPESCSKQFPRSSVVKSSRILREIASPQLNELGDKMHLDAQDSPSISFAERQRKWKEEWDQELERERDSLKRSSLPLPPSLIACSQWQKEECIGSGSFGIVYRGFNSEHGQFCAIKEVLVVLNDPRSKEQLKQLNQEICFLKLLSHQNIVQYYGSILTNATLSIYMEYVSEGSVHMLLGKHDPFKESVIRNYTAQILSGLAYLHERRHIHRDIKGANILVGSNGIVKLADFGVAKHISTLTEVHTSNTGTPYWMAPEVIVSKHRGKGYNLSADIWSLGCTVVEMATGKHPLPEFEPVAAMFKIANDTYEPEIPDKLSDEGKDFLLQCFRRDPRSRPTATQLMDHPFVREYLAAF